MKGLELTGAYARDLALPALERSLGAEGLARLAVGSVGDGSDRFGFDDDISRDHDWGVSLCIWVPDDENTLAARVSEAMQALPAEYEGFPVLGFHTACPTGRAGVFTVGEHYKRFTGLPAGPCTLDEWRTADEHALAAATNGAVFHDGPGAFTAVRERLLLGYPEPVRLERTARRCFSFAQAGQYNLIRAVLRRNTVACRVAYARAHEAACLLTHVLAGRFCPYYKWMQASCARLGELGSQVAAALAYLAAPDGPVESFDAAGTKEMLEAMGQVFTDELFARGLIDSASPYLLDHVDHIRTLAQSAGDTYAHNI